MSPTFSRVLRAMANRSLPDLQPPRGRGSPDRERVRRGRRGQRVELGYHLRELERTGSSSGSQTRRGMAASALRTTGTGFSFHPADDDRDDPAARRASSELVHLGIDERLARSCGRRCPRRPARGVARCGGAPLLRARVSPVELAALVAAIDGLVRPYIGLTRDAAPADAAPVHVTFQAFRLPREGDRAVAATATRSPLRRRRSRSCGPARSSATSATGCCSSACPCSCSSSRGPR